MLNKKNFEYAALLASLICLIPPAANAQSDSDIIESARTCQSVTGLSPRLACYDRILPPTAQTVNNNDDDSLAAREELEKTVANLKNQLELNTTAKITEVQEISLSSSRLIAADGRVFVRSRAPTVIKWPATPFNVEIVTAILGQKYLIVPGRKGRVRVKVKE